MRGPLVINEGLFRIQWANCDNLGGNVVEKGWTLLSIGQLISENDWLSKAVACDVTIYSLTRILIWTLEKKLTFHRALKNAECLFFLKPCVSLLNCNFIEQKQESNSCKESSQRLSYEQTYLVRLAQKF